MPMLSQTQLLGLYVSQGVPAGFQSNLVPLLFRLWNKSYRLNAVVHLSYLPWVLKPLVAPYFEDANSLSVSRTLLLSGLIQILICYAVVKKETENIVILMLAANICTALYDIFVDKLAIKQRNTSALDFANVFQVVGYKFGLLLTGAFVLYCTSHFFGGNFDAFAISPLISATVLLSMCLWMSITSVQTKIPVVSKPNGTISKSFADTYRQIYRHFRNHIPLYAMLITYKAGESIGDSLLKPFLRDSGFDLKLLANMGLINEVFSICGSLTMVWNSKQHRTGADDFKQLRLFLLLNMLPQGLRALVVCNKQAQQFGPIVLITLLENFIGGAVTVACFNFMFSNVLPGIEGTHYALYSSVEVLGKILASFGANLAVETLGFQNTFLSAIALSAVPVLLCRLDGVQYRAKVNKLF